MEINQESLNKIVEVLHAIAKRIAKAVQNIWIWIKGNANRLYKLLELEHSPNKDTQKHKLNFTHHKVHHQVIERKPRHLVKKIIR